MLVFYRFLVLLKRSLATSAIILLCLVIYIKFFMYNISNNITAMEKRIIELENIKHTLKVELTYLTSTERLLAIMDKNPYILEGKDITKPNQLKSSDEFRKISFAKIKNNPHALTGIAKNDTTLNKNNVN